LSHRHEKFGAEHVLIVDAAALGISREFVSQRTHRGHATAGDVTIQLLDVRLDDIAPQPHHLLQHHLRAVAVAPDLVEACAQSRHGSGVLLSTGAAAA
jgi:hypothetical protein